MCARHLIEWDDSLLTELYLGGVPLKEIAERLGVRSAARVDGRRAQLGLPKRQKGSGPISKTMVENLRRNGYTIRKIAETLGSSIGTVARILKQRGVPRRSHKHRLHNETTAAIVRAYRSGITSYQVLGRMFKMKPNQIGHRIRKILGPGQHGGRRTCSSRTTTKS